MPQVVEVNDLIGSSDWAQSGDDWISEIGPQQSVLVLAIPPLKDPHQHGGHVLTYTQEKNEQGGAPISLMVELRQGYVDEEHDGTLIQRWSPEKLNAEGTIRGRVLPKQSSAKITDYGNLALRFIANQEPGSED